MLKRIIILICIFALIITMGGEVILSALTVSAASEEKQYSNVLDDLKKDSTFDAGMYPDDTEDVSVKLIQIAESEDGQLFLYVYQPADSKIDLKCTSVSISVGFSSNGQGLSPQLYDLILVSSEGVFDKYLVNGFVLPDEAERYYNIVELHREYNSAVDKETSVVTGAIAYPVGQQWCAYSLNDHLVYEMNTFETMDINILLAGNILVRDGFKWIDVIGKDKSYRSHLLVFDCEKYVIEHIFDADLTFKVRYKEYKQNPTGNGSIFDVSYPNGEGYLPKDVTLSDNDDPIILDAGGLFSKTYDYKRIMTGKEFKENIVSDKIKIDDTLLENIPDNSFVFSFYETEYTEQSLNSIADICTDYDVDGVTVLRLHFRDISGKIYDLGVVSDKVSTNNQIGEGGGTDWDELTNMLGIILGLFGLCAIFFMLSFISPIIKDFINAIWGGIKFGFNVSIAIITWPFRFLWGLLSGK